MIDAIFNFTLLKTKNDWIWNLTSLEDKMKVQKSQNVMPQDLENAIISTINWQCNRLQNKQQEEQILV